jgi:hypothetical protein
MTDDLQTLLVRSDGTPPGTTVMIGGEVILDVVALSLKIDARHPQLVQATLTFECRTDLELSSLAPDSLASPPIVQVDGHAIPEAMKTTTHFRHLSK